MYDITNLITLVRASQWIKIIKNNIKDIPILLVGNKLDLEENRPAFRRIKKTGLQIGRNFDSYV